MRSHQRALAPAIEPPGLASVPVAMIDLVQASPRSVAVESTAEYLRTMPSMARVSSSPTLLTWTTVEGRWRDERPCQEVGAVPPDPPVQRWHCLDRRWMCRSRGAGGAADVPAVRASRRSGAIRLLYGRRGSNRRQRRRNPPNRPPFFSSRAGATPSPAAAAAAAVAALPSPNTTVASA